MRFERGDKSVHVIRNLLYLYSLGTEYYDTVNNNTLHIYYKQKSNSLINDPDVVTALENNSTNMESIELFDENNLYKFQVYDKSSNNGSDSHSALKTSPSICITGHSDTSIEELHRPSKNRCISTKIFQRLSLFDDPHYAEEEQMILSKFISDQSMFDANLKSDLDRQSDKFEKRKKNRLLKQYLIKKKKIKPYIKRSQETLSASHHTIHKSDTIRIMDDLLILAQQKVMCEQKEMEVEIEKLIKKNLEEMHKNIDQLKESLVNEAKSMEENGFPHVAKKLYAEIEVEVEEMKEQYEESRITEIEKIRLKYVKGLK